MVESDVKIVVQVQRSVQAVEDVPEALQIKNTADCTILTPLIYRMHFDLFQKIHLEILCMQ